MAQFFFSLVGLHISEALQDPSILTDFWTYEHRIPQGMEKNKGIWGELKMKAMVLNEISTIEEEPLKMIDLPISVSIVMGSSSSLLILRERKGHER